MAKRYVVSFVDYNDSCDGKARISGLFKTEEEARAWVVDDMKQWLDNNSGEVKFDVDYDKMSIASDDYNEDIGCEWNVHEVDVDACDVE